MLEKIGDKLPTLHVARGLIITDAQELILVRRLPKPGETQGKLELPGGKYNPRIGFGAELMREVEEETGLEIEPFGQQWQIECRVLQKRRGSPYSGFKLTLASRAAIRGGELRPQASEVSEIMKVYIPEVGQFRHELTQPTLEALGAFGLHGFGTLGMSEVAA